MFQNKNNIRVDIDRFWFDTDGQILDASAVPSNLRTRLPFFMWGKFDYDCNYRNASLSLNSEPWQYVGCYNRSEIKFLFTGLNTIQTRMKNGDLSLLFTDDLIAPSIYAIVVLSSQGSGITGIIENASFYAPYMDLGSNNPYEDFLESLLFMQISKFGVATKQDFYPLSDAFGPGTPEDNPKIAINTDFLADSQNVLGGWINYNTSAYYIDFRRVKYDIED